MKVYNEDKTKELIEYDIALGYLKNDKILIKHNDEIKENIVYKTTVFSNGGISKVPDMEKSIFAKEAYDEYEDIQIYIPYTETEIKDKKIEELKAQLIELNFDLLQDQAGLIIPNLNEKKAEFVSLHNELRTLLGKETRGVK